MVRPFKYLGKKEKPFEVKEVNVKSNLLESIKRLLTALSAPEIVRYSASTILTGTDEIIRGN